MKVESLRKSRDLFGGCEFDLYLCWFYDNPESFELSRFEHKITQTRKGFLIISRFHSWKAEFGFLLCTPLRFRALRVPLPVLFAGGESNVTNF